MNVKIVVAILLIAAAPVCAQAQTPSVPRVSKDDAQKVVRIISGDKAKIQTYCDIQTLGEQMERAYEKRNLKLVDELLQKIETLEKTLGPEYVALVDRLGDIDPEKDKLADEITSVFAPLDRLCRTQRLPLQLTPLTERSSKGNCPLRYCGRLIPAYSLVSLNLGLFYSGSYRIGAAPHGSAAPTFSPSRPQRARRSGSQLPKEIVVLSGRNASAPHFFSRGGNVIEHKDRDGRPVSSASKVRAERFFHREKEGGAKALSEYEAKQESTRLLTAKLRAERLAREAARAKPAPDPRKAAET